MLLNEQFNSIQLKEMDDAVRYLVVVIRYEVGSGG